MRSPDSATTRLDDYIVDMLPWAHGHQHKAIRDFVQALIDQQTGCQAQLARSFGKQEAAAKRLSRLLHNERLEPRYLAQARIQQISAWSRLFALVAIALLVVVSLASRLLLRPGTQASALLRRVASRRRGRCELSVVSAMLSLLHQDPGLYDHLVPRLKLKLEGDLANVS